MRPEALCLVFVVSDFHGRLVVRKEWSLQNESPRFRRIDEINENVSKKLGTRVELKAEFCYHVISREEFMHVNHECLTNLLSHSPFERCIRFESKFKKYVEIGPRTCVKSAMCTNILSVFEIANIRNVNRVERSILYNIEGLNINENEFFEIVGDKMTEMIFDEKTNFEQSSERANFFEIDVIGDGKSLEKANEEFGLALDRDDLDFYYNVFANKFHRNPTDVELFDLAQSDSEHSRHWFFRAKLIIDSNEIENSLMDHIKSTLEHSNRNSLIAFHDNSSAIRGFSKVNRIRPTNPEMCSSFRIASNPSHLIYSAETHNFPTAVCPFQGAATGTGGRIRDIHATGRGAFEIAGVAGYSFGNLHIPDFELPWESKNEIYPTSMCDPLRIAIEASNGASDYGNKFGEPVVICGFARSFGMRLANGERCEYLKPIMFSGGIGTIDEDELTKQMCAPGMIVAKIGGPVYRIGVGGGATSSISVQGDRENELDFAAVQRGDAEMGSKLHRVVRGCAERAHANPLLSIHDQGAGGNGNVIKELVEGCGVRVKSDEFQLGDGTISIRELWTAEYQENDAALVDPNLKQALLKIAKREKCHVSFVGEVTRETRVILEDFGCAGSRNPVDLNTHLLGEREMKTFHLSIVPTRLVPLKLPDSLTVREALSRVLRLPSVASKRYLTCKVDRSVSGLIAQQQCVGPLHTPLADVGVVAVSHFEKVFKI
ncbi:unnamed protein product [Caenorhabditis bovis]|uniref:Phosphoribosylformylglycinamidine synthase n=1 Tax=Caenorhabditis bovis TaxID=2654633 RepID=A0A8S1EKD1_9PELO|nr:unnamed protein product [Caenorhabditis bovis]